MSKDGRLDVWSDLLIPSAQWRLRLGGFRFSCFILAPLNTHSVTELPFLNFG